MILVNFQNKYKSVLSFITGFQGGASSTEYGIAMGAAVVAVLLVLFGVGLCLCVILQYLKQQREGPDGQYRPALSRDVYSVEAVNIGELDLNNEHWCFQQIQLNVLFMSNIHSEFIDLHEVIIAITILYCFNFYLNCFHLVLYVDVLSLSIDQLTFALYAWYAQVSNKWPTCNFLFSTFYCSQLLFFYVISILHFTVF